MFDIVRKPPQTIFISSCKQKITDRLTCCFAENINPNFFCIFDTIYENMETLMKRITINPEICHGKPVIRNMRYPVELILDLLSSGMTFSEIVLDYPSLEEEDIKACLAFASRLTKVKTIYKVA